MKKSVVLALAGMGALSLVGLVIARVAVFEMFKVPAGSMLPTIAVGSRVVVSKMSKPERGAVMVFHYPEHREQDFVKRVVAMPGEKLEVKAQRVFINDWEVPRCEVGAWDYEDTTDSAKHHSTLWLEHLGAVSFLVMHDKNGFAEDYQGPYRVKDGEYFVLGDNRENSHDSRMWFGGVGGGVPSADMIGRVTSADEPKLPPGAEGLQAAFDACMAKKPAKTTP